MVAKWRIDQMFGTLYSSKILSDLILKNIKIIELKKLSKGVNLDRTLATTQ